jgi:hypothetical protein
VNCSEIRSVTCSVFIHPLFAFCRRSPQLILRLYYVSDWGIFYARWQHVAPHSRAATSKPTCANSFPSFAQDEGSQSEGGNRVSPRLFQMAFTTSPARAIQAM